jgi:hypothetical protein
MAPAQPVIDFPQSEKRKGQNNSTRHRQGNVYRHVFIALVRRIHQGEKESGKRQPVGDDVCARVGHCYRQHQKPE